MWVRMTRAVVAGRQARAIGNVIELPEVEARTLILAKCAVQCDAPPAPRAEPGGIETAEARPDGEQAVSRKRKS